MRRNLFDDVTCDDDMCEAHKGACAIGQFADGLKLENHQILEAWAFLTALTVYNAVAPANRVLAQALFAERVAQLVEAAISYGEAVARGEIVDEELDDTIQ